MDVSQSWSEADGFCKTPLLSWQLQRGFLYSWTYRWPAGHPVLYSAGQHIHDTCGRYDVEAFLFRHQSLGLPPQAARTSVSARHRPDFPARQLGPIACCLASLFALEDALRQLHLHRCLEIVVAESLHVYLTDLLATALGNSQSMSSLAGHHSCRSRN